MSSSELMEHAGYFRDVKKLQAYQRALADVVQPGDVVVDLGAGTGLLGLMAASAGAARVYMVDRGPILGLANEIAARNGLADRVVAVRGDSEDVILPELADVIVCDQIGGFVYDAGVLEFFDDARRRLLKPGGTMIPGSFTLHMAPANAPAVRENIDIWSTRPAGFDTEPLHQSAVNNEWRLDASEAELCAGSALIATIDSWSLARVEVTVSFQFDAPKRVDGLLGWFDAELSPGVHVSSAPDDPDRMRRWCNFYPLAQALDVEAGDVLTASIDLRPDPGILNWSTTWRRGEERIGCWRQSTLLGQFLAPEDLLGASDARSVERTPTGDALASALNHIGGDSSAGSIIDTVIGEYPGAFASPARARTVLSRELAKWARVRP